MRPLRSCKVCSLPTTSERELVEGAFLAGWSPRSISARFKTLTRTDVRRHAERCSFVVKVEEKTEE